MSFFNFGKYGRMLMLSAVLAVGAICVSGCGGGNKDASSGKSEQGAVSGKSGKLTDSRDGQSSGKSEQGAVSGKSGKLTDSRDGQKYKTVKIDNQVWMAENLRFKIGDSWCYENSDENCNKYGRLYDWETAKAACQLVGMRLPSREEWDNLGQAAGGERKPDSKGNIDWYGAGKKLKSTSGWNENGNGTDSYGFSALPGGSHSYGSFFYAGSYGFWWTATEYGDVSAYRRGMLYYDDIVVEDNDNKDYGYSVRCVKD